MGAIDEKTIDGFRRFIAQAEPHLSDPVEASAPVTAFEQFVETATPLALHRIRRRLPELITLLQRIEPWLASHDLLGIAGFRLAEDPYTRLIAWALAPGTHPPSAAARQESWLRRLGLAHLLPLEQAAEPMTQVLTDDGIPDIVLHYPRFAVVVEAKTVTSEHGTPSGEPQTFSYAKAIRRRLRLSTEFPVVVVFLTVAGESPANPDARVTTFVDFSMSLIDVLDPLTLPPDSRWAVAGLLTHLLTSAASDELDLSDLTRTILNWRQQPGWEQDESLLLRRIADLEAAMSILSLE